MFEVLKYKEMMDLLGSKKPIGKEEKDINLDFKKLCIFQEKKRNYSSIYSKIFVFSLCGIEIALVIFLLLKKTNEDISVNNTNFELDSFDFWE